LLYLQVRNNQVGWKNYFRNSKTIQLASNDDIFLKNFGKIHKF